MTKIKEKFPDQIEYSDTYRSIYNVAGITTQNDNKWADVLKNRWGIEYTYDDQNRPMVYNTGVVVISKKGLQKMKKNYLF